MNKTRCKFVCNSYTVSGSGENRIKSFSFMPVYSGSPENEEFFKWTPGGDLSLSVVNPDVEFEPDKEYYIDIIEAGE